MTHRCMRAPLFLSQPSLSGVMMEGAAAAEGRAEATAEVISHKQRCHTSPPVDGRRVEHLGSGASRGVPGPGDLQTPLWLPLR